MQGLLSAPDCSCLAEPVWETHSPLLCMHNSFFRAVRPAPSPRACWSHFSVLNTALVTEWSGTGTQNITGLRHSVCVCDHQHRSHVNTTSKEPRRAAEKPTCPSCFCPTCTSHQKFGHVASCVALHHAQCPFQLLCLGGLCLARPQGCCKPAVLPNFQAWSVSGKKRVQGLCFEGVLPGLPGGHRVDVL